MTFYKRKRGTTKTVTMVSPTTNEMMQQNETNNPSFSDENPPKSIFIRPNIDQSIQKLQESEQESIIKKLKAELEAKTQQLAELENENSQKLKEQQEKLDQLNSEIAKMQQINNNTSVKSIEEENNKLLDEINKLKDEKMALDEEISKKQVICENLEKDVKNINQVMRSLPHYQQIKKLQELMSQMERDTNEKLTVFQRQEKELNNRIKTLKDELDQYNLTAEDLQNQNTDLYTQRSELRSKFQEVFLEYQKLNLTIQAQGTYIPIERYNLEINNAKKANQKNLDKHRQTWQKFLEKLRKENEDLKKEIVSQDQIITDLKNKSEKLSEQYTEITTSKRREIQNLKQEKMKLVEEFGIQPINRR